MEIVWWFYAGVDYCQLRLYPRLNGEHIQYMIRWLVGWLVGWLVDWLID